MQEDVNFLSLKKEGRKKKKRKGEVPFQVSTMKEGILTYPVHWVNTNISVTA